MKKPALPAYLLPLLAVFLLLGACASARATATIAPSAQSGAQGFVRPGDQVALQIWNEPEMSDTFAVMESGEVVLPKLGAVPAADKTVAGLQESLRVAYQEYLRNPSVEIIVLRRVGISGQVRDPGIYLVDLTVTLRDMIALAGGLTEAANPNDVIILRGTDRIAFEGQTDQSYVVAELRSGDQVVVGARSFIARNPMVAISSGLGIVSFFLSQILPLLK